VIGEVIQGDVVFLEALVEGFQRFHIFDLNRHMVETDLTLADRLGPLGSLEQGNIMMDLATGEKGREVGLAGDFKPEHLGVELGRRFHIAHVEDHMSDSLGRGHTLTPLEGNHEAQPGASDCR
jgi:hypothetical protein